MNRTMNTAFAAAWSSAMLAGVATSGTAMAGGFAGFGPPTAFVTGDGPHDIAVGDLTGDGVLDMVAVNTWEDTVVVLRGEGDGTFVMRDDQPVINAPQSVALGDLDGDGDLDVAVVGEYSDNFVGILLNRGDGRLNSMIPYGTGDGPRCVAIADLTGDGDADVVVANRMDANFSLLAGNGNGTLQPQVTFPMGGAAHDLKIADLDLDGHLDVLTANWGGNAVAVALNDGNGGFDGPVLAPTGQMPFGVDVADFDEDGHPDLATSNFWDGTVSVMRGNGDGTFGAAASIPIDESNLEDVVASDFNRDGNFDIAVINGFWYTVSLLLGNGDGTFQPRQVFDSGPFPRDLKAADFDRDGDPDLVTADLADDQVSFIRNLTTPPIRAEITGISMVAGTLMHGDIDDIAADDDQTLRTRSGFGQTFIDLHNTTMVVSAATNAKAPATVHVSIDSRLDQSPGTAIVSLWNWNTARFHQIGAYALGDTDSIESFEGIEAGPYVNDQGQIDLQVKHRVFVPVFAFQFDSFFDLVELAIEE